MHFNITLNPPRDSKTYRAKNALRITEWYCTSALENGLPTEDHQAILVLHTDDGQTITLADSPQELHRFARDIRRCLPVDFVPDPAYGETPLETDSILRLE